jgi:hypothetical protein
MTPLDLTPSIEHPPVPSAHTHNNIASPIPRCSQTCLGSAAAATAQCRCRFFASVFETTDHKSRKKLRWKTKRRFWLLSSFTPARSPSCGCITARRLSFTPTDRETPDISPGGPTPFSYNPYGLYQRSHATWKRCTYAARWGLTIHGFLGIAVHVGRL